jgi:hypothetical protein
VSRTCSISWIAGLIIGPVNEALRPKFLDLKEGAKVVSLAPFVPGVNARMTKRNVSQLSCVLPA